MAGYFRDEDVPWRVQPQSPTGIRLEGLGAGLFASIDGNNVNLNGAASPLVPGRSLVVVTDAGYAHNTNGASYDRYLQIDRSIGATAPWSIACTLYPSGNVSLSHLVGFGLSYTGGNELDTAATYFGKYRALLNFNSNYYFWGSNFDWDTGIAFDTDGSKHTVLVTDDGVTLRFYRDGALRASTARSGSLAATVAGKYFVLGNEHDGGAAGPNAKIVSGRAWSRCLSASEVLAYTGNTNLVYAPQTRRIWVPVSAGGGTSLTIQDATHAHTADSLALTLDTTLAIADATHAHTADNLSLTVTGATDLTIADSTHAHSADSATITLGYADLLIADALHGHAADNLDLTVDGSVDLVIDDALHGHTADTITLEGVGADNAGGRRRAKTRKLSWQEYDVPMPAEVLTSSIPSDKVVEPISLGGSKPAAVKPSKLAPKSKLATSRKPKTPRVASVAPVVQASPVAAVVAPESSPVVAVAKPAPRPMMLSDMLAAESMTNEEMLAAIKMLARLHMGPQLMRDTPRAKLIRQAQ